jgi:hypothetical protein
MYGRLPQPIEKMFEKQYDELKSIEGDVNADIQVKILDEFNYASTREFYEAMSFRPLECLPELWGKDNPCLVMVMYIGR